MRSVSYLKVEGHETLVRDTSTKAIIATDNKEYQDYMTKRKQALQSIKTLQSHEKEIDNIKRDLSEIKNLLIKLIEEK